MNYTNVLLMTSTIAPADDVFMLVRKDPELRLADYKASFEFQINLLKSDTIDAIVYADNSGFPLDHLKNICEKAGVSDRVEFISYKSDALPSLGRYFLEINLIGRAIAVSKLLSADVPLRIWKLTGRYIVTNIGKIIREAPDCDLYINCRNHPEPWADFYLAAFTMRGYTEILAKDPEKYRDTIVGERILREIIDTKSFLGCKIVKRFTRVPWIFGVRGLDGVQYSSFSGTMKYYIRIAANRIMPSLWI
ncbi:MAG: hypothetical protein Q8L53_00425 [Aestuariivirga sp.]|nr:hypothetical protein [Aestuariivirga sp.]